MAIGNGYGFIISDIKGHPPSPSAIALMVMILAGFAFSAKRRGKELAFLTSLITLTKFKRKGIIFGVTLAVYILIAVAGNIILR